MNDRQIPFALGSFSRADKSIFLGVVQGQQVTPVAALGPAFSEDDTLFSLLEDWAASLKALKAGVASDAGADRRIPLGELVARAPLPQARQIFCAGANYRKHVVEMIVAVGGWPEIDAMNPAQRQVFGEAYVARQIAESNPYIFQKTITSIAGPFDDLALPDFSERADWEIELGVVIGARTHKISREQAPDAVAGYMVVNDLTARDKVKRTDPGAIGPDWIAAKGAPGFLPTGPLFVPAEFITDPYGLRMRLIVNGEVMQDELTSDMTFDIARQIEYISAHTLMLPGDILCTGSPAGNGVARGQFLKDGDVMEAEIDGLGRQVVRCVAPAAG